MVSDITADEALAKLTPDERAHVDEFRTRVRALLADRLKDLRIYGSKVRGESHDESDIDLLVLIDGFDAATAWAIVDLARSISPWLSANVIDFEGYHAPASRASGFYKEMRKESVRL